MICLAFFLFSSVSVIKGLFLLKFVCLLAKKNLLFRRNFGRSYERRHSKFSPTHLLEGWWVTVQGYLQNNLNNLKPKSKTLGLCPKPHSLARPQGQVAKPTHLPLRRVLVDSKASRVKCTASPPLTPFHLHENSETIRSGRSRKPVKACEATA